MEKISLQEIVAMNYGENVPFPESLDDIYCTIQSFSSEEDTKLINIGKSKEGRDISCLKIGSGKKIVLADARFEHPHEYHGTPSLLRLAELLAKEKLWKCFDSTFYILPAASPDGVVRNTWVKRGAGVVEYLKARIDRTSSSFSPAFNGFTNPSDELKQYIRFYEEIKPNYYFSLHGDSVTEKNCMILHNSYQDVQKEIEKVRKIWNAKKHLIIKMAKNNKPSVEAMTMICDGILTFDKMALEELNKKLVAAGYPKYVSKEESFADKFGTKSFTLEASYSQELSEDLIKITPRKIISNVNKRLTRLKHRARNADIAKMIDDYLEKDISASYLTEWMNIKDVDKAKKTEAKDATCIKYFCNLWAFDFESKIIKALGKENKRLAKSYKAKLYQIAEGFPTKVYKKFYQESAEEKTDWIISTMLAILA